ncbi:globin domain-containing protein [Amycolatopsis decaplanina]|uniref:nitric oxide dioxygenase n=1 Tax=Amycolatopsis decaplanina DSM 44594 TaxID=1284240 RepID=M2X4A5_9PSEU|nr:globin domain-containing protein [Amycolatopsis decaplanina]EME55861.1 oxidoreductase FAD-binding subunit [Amycolatopsis decaplanina DSM 44594]
MLSPASAAVIRATLPVVRAHDVEITGEFYSSMFSAHPELLDLFNQGNQADGRQQLALASAVVGFAEYLITEAGEAAAPFERIAERIAHKHVSLGIRAEQYPIVGHHLLTAVGTVLGAAVTPEIFAAWHEVYWLLACRLIAAEARLYERGDLDSADLWRRWRVAKRLDEAVDAVSFTLVPDDGAAVPDFAPGQYVSVAVDLPDGRRQPRQYSLSHGPGRGSLRITVRRVRGRDGAPDGVVSNHLHDHVTEDDTLLLGPPAGETTLDIGDGPALLVSAGIGITPMAAMLDHLARTQPTRRIILAHADRSPAHHALRRECAQAATGLAEVDELYWYENDHDDHSRPGLMDVGALPLHPGTTAYLCGPLPFMHGIRAGLIGRGLPADRIRYEVFGPGMLDRD